MLGARLLARQSMTSNVLKMRELATTKNSSKLCTHQKEMDCGMKQDIAKLDTSIKELDANFKKFAKPSFLDFFIAANFAFLISAACTKILIS